jgi:hypothetical protein
MPQSTTQQRIKGIQPKLGSVASNYCLMPVQEESFKQWILSMDQSSMSPRIGTVQEIAGILVAQRVEPVVVKLIGINWVQTLVKRHNDLRFKFNQKYDYQCAKYKDPVFIRSWFKRVQDMKIQYGILDDNI